MQLTNKEINERFIHACQTNNVQDVLYYLTSQELSYHPEYDDHHEGLSAAIQSESVDVVECLLFHPEIIKKPVLVSYINNVYAQVNMLKGNIEILRIFMRAGLDMYNRKECYLLATQRFPKQLDMCDLLLDGPIDRPFFEETEHHFSWWLKQTYISPFHHTIIRKMLKVFYNTDPMLYIVKREEYTVWCAARGIPCNLHDIEQYESGVSEIQLSL